MASRAVSPPSVVNGHVAAAAATAPPSPSVGRGSALEAAVRNEHGRGDAVGDGTVSLAVALVRNFGTSVFRRCWLAAHAAANGSSAAPPADLSARRALIFAGGEGAGDAAQAVATDFMDMLEQLDRRCGRNERRAAGESAVPGSGDVDEVLVGAGFDLPIGSSDTLGSFESSVDRASRPLGFSYRPRHRQLKLARAEGVDVAAADGDDAGDDMLVNTTLRCIEPASTRKGQINEDVNLHTTPRRALFASLEDIAAAEQPKMRGLVRLCVHLVTYGTTRGLPMQCALQLDAVCEQLKIEFGTADRRMAELTDGAIAMLAGEIRALTAFAETREQMLAICDDRMWQEESTADDNAKPYTTRATTGGGPSSAEPVPLSTAGGGPDAVDGLGATEPTVGAAMPNAPRQLGLSALQLGPLRDLPAPVAVKNPFAATLYPGGAGLTLPSGSTCRLFGALMRRVADTERWQRLAVLTGFASTSAAPPDELRATAASVAVEMGTGFILPFLAHGFTDAAVFGRGASKEIATALIAGRLPAPEDTQPMFPPGACRTDLGATTQTANGGHETWAPLTMSLLVALDSFLSCARGIERLWVMLQADVAAVERVVALLDATSVTSSWVTKLRAIPGITAEGAGPIITLHSAALKLFRALHAVRKCNASRVCLALLMQAQAQRFFSGGGSAAISHLPVVSETSPATPTAPSYVFATHVLDVVGSDVTTLVAAVVQPRTGLVRALPLAHLLSDVV